MSNPYDNVIKCLRQEYAELHKEEKSITNKKIEDWKTKGSNKPNVDSRILGFIIKKMMLAQEADPLESARLGNEIWKYLVDRSFQCKLLEYELDKIQKK